MNIKESIKIKTDVNFADNIINIYVYKIFKVYKTKRELEKEEEENLAEDNVKSEQQKIFEQEQASLIEELTKERPQLLFTKKFKIAADYKSLIIDEKTYKIPDFFNKETLKSNDLKTWEMVFIYIYDDEINKKVKILLKEPNPNSVEKLRNLKSATDNEDA